MSGLHTETVQPKHAYTKVDIPWELGKKNLMRAYGRSVSQAKADARVRKVYCWLAVFAAVWLVLYFG